MEASALSSAEIWLSWIATAKLVAAALVAFGVALEFAADWIARPHEEVVKNAHDLQLAQLRKETESERLARAEIEERLAPRHLTIEQQRVLIDVIRPFAPASIIIISPAPDLEANQLAEQFRSVLVGAGTPPINMIGKALIGGAIGVHLAGRNEQLVSAIGRALKSFGFALGGNSKGNAATPFLTYPGGDFPEAKNAAASIFVGAKPLPMIASP